MKNKINHFLVSSLIAVCIVCIGVFAVLTLYINKQNDETVSQLGNIYMFNINNRIIKHFETMTEHRMTQLETLAETIPPEYINDEDALNQWLVYNVQTRGFDAAAYCYSDGSLEMLYGDGLTPTEPMHFSTI